MTSIQKKHKTSLAEYATEVKRLVVLAYPDLPAIHRKRPGLDSFDTTVGNEYTMYLQRHLLAVVPDSLKDAVPVGNKFLQVKENTPLPQHEIIVIDCLLSFLWGWWRTSMASSSVIGISSKHGMPRLRAGMLCLMLALPD